jgi:ABC-2 type transport system ATP-binding protein
VPTSDTPAVEVRDLTIRHGQILAVDELSFTAAMGQVTTLLGPNGAGKTSTVETLEGYRVPTSGKVRVLGLDPVADHRSVVRRIGVMLQDGGVATGMRVGEVVHLSASYYDDPVDPDDLISRLALHERRRTAWRHLSGGERQRVLLALALVGRPKVVFLDEPTAGVDPVGRRAIRAMISELRDSGTCILLTTHDLDDAQHLSDHVIIIDHGRLVAAGSPSDLVQNVAGDEVRFTASPGLDRASLGAAIGGHDVEEVSPGVYRVTADPTPANIAALTAWLAEHHQPLHDLRAGRQSLEDVFVRLTSGDKSQP